VPPAEPDWSIVTVLPGDSMSTLAGRFMVSVQELAEWNQLDEAVLPKVGQRLRVFSHVPSVERFRLRIKLKEDSTWRQMADRYQLPLATMLALNKRTKSGRIRAGKRITVYVTKDRWNKRWLDGGLQLQSRPGLIVKHLEWSWGRPVTVRTIEAVADLINETFPGSSMVVGDLSLKRGGRFPPHTAHQGGLDADLGLFVGDEPATVKFSHIKPRAMDSQRTWFMLHELIKSGRVARILLDWYHQAALYKQAQAAGLSEELLKAWFQYPAKRWKQTGLIRHYKGHKNHIHIRFKEPEGEVVL
jgi:hypothetical protein